MKASIETGYWRQGYQWQEQCQDIAHRACILVLMSKIAGGLDDYFNNYDEVMFPNNDKDEKLSANDKGICFVQMRIKPTKGNGEKN